MTVVGPTARLTRAPGPWRLRSPSALDISMVPDGTTGYDDLAPGAVGLPFQGRFVGVAGLADVIRSKEAAGREKDIVVLPALRAHLRRRGG